MHLMIRIAAAAAAATVYLSAASAAAGAQAIPDAPTPQTARAAGFAPTRPAAAQRSPTLTPDHALLAFDATARLILDPWSTSRAISRGGYEENLPPQIADHPGMMVAYGAAVIGAEWLAARELRRHAGEPGRWIARGMFLGDGTYELHAVVGNLEIRRVAEPPGTVYKFN